MPMKFGNIVRVEISRYLIKITTLRRKPDREYSFTFLGKILIRYTFNFARLLLAVYSNRSERLYLRSAFLRSVMIFVKYREVSTRTVLPNFIDLSAETALYSRLEAWAKRARKRQVLNCFNSNSPSQPGQFPRATR